MAIVEILVLSAYLGHNFHHGLSLYGAPSVPLPQLVADGYYEAMGVEELEAVLGAVKYDLENKRYAGWDRSSLRGHYSHSVGNRPINN